MSLLEKSEAVPSADSVVNVRCFPAVMSTVHVVQFRRIHVASLVQFSRIRVEPRIGSSHKLVHKTTFLHRFLDFGRCWIREFFPPTKDLACG